MLHLLKRHPFPVKAYFRQSLVVTYAFPVDVVRPLLSPGLVLDTYGNYGFLAIALVRTERLRPSFLPGALGRDFFLAGYRIFARLGSSRSSLRGLQVLRSDTDRRFMVHAGNLLTHYRYRLCRAQFREAGGMMEWSIRTPHQEADIEVIAHIAEGAARLPAGSPFSNEHEARRFAGPLPYTFDYEAETKSIARVRGVRRNWKPQPIAVHVRRCTFLDHAPFCQAKPILANAFYLHDVPYKWERGDRVPVEAA